MTNRDLYTYFYESFNHRNSRPGKHTRENWNKKAGEWKAALGQDSSMRQMTKQRVTHSIALLQKHGLLGPDISMLDVGCGPGRFVAGFAPFVGQVTGIDISDEMIREGAAHCQSLGLGNTHFQVLDFKKDDQWLSEHREAFDLCFSFMSPAVSKTETLQRMMDLSKGWCASGFVLSRSSRLEQIILETLAPKPEELRAEADWFYNMFNLLWLEGYRPRVDYFTANATEQTTPTAEDIRHLIRRLTLLEQVEEESVEKILDIVKAEAQGGEFLQTIENTYGMLIWNKELALY